MEVCLLFKWEIFSAFLLQVTHIFSLLFLISFSPKFSHFFLILVYSVNWTSAVILKSGFFSHFATRRGKRRSIGHGLWRNSSAPARLWEERSLQQKSSNYSWNVERKIEMNLKNFWRKMSSDFVLYFSIFLWEIFNSRCCSCLCNKQRLNV